MKIIAYAILFVAGFILFAAVLLNGKGMLTADTLQQARETLLGEPEPDEPLITEIEQIPDEAAEFVRQLQQEQRQLKLQQDQLDEDRRHLAQEREEMNELYGQVSTMLADIEIKEKMLLGAASKQITDMAGDFRKMKAPLAAAQIANLGNELAVPILREIPSTNRAKIFAAMTPQRATELQREFLSP